MDLEGQRNSLNPSAMLASLLNRRAKLNDELRNIERQLYDMETSYLRDPSQSQCRNVLKGFEGFLSTSKSTTLRRSMRLVEIKPRLADIWVPVAFRIIFELLIVIFYCYPRRKI